MGKIEKTAWVCVILTFIFLIIQNFLLQQQIQKMKKIKNPHPKKIKKEKMQILIADWQKKNKELLADHQNKYNHKYNQLILQIKQIQLDNKNTKKIIKNNQKEITNIKKIVQKYQIDAIKKEEKKIKEAYVRLYSQYKKNFQEIMELKRRYKELYLYVRPHKKSPPKNSILKRILKIFK